MTNIPKWKAYFILFVCFAGIFFTLPNLIEDKAGNIFPSWMQKVNLGLDLQGGSQILLKVDMDEGIKDSIHVALDSVRASLRSAKIGYVNLATKGTAVTFKLREPNQQSAALEVLRKIPDMVVDVEPDNIIKLSYSEESLKKRKESMLHQSIEIVRRRIDEFGTTEPNIQQQGIDRILIQLPGIKDPTRLTELLGKTAKLTFRIVHEHSDELVAEHKTAPGYILMENADQLDGRPLLVSKEILLTGENLVDAQVGFGDFNKPKVDMSFDSFGSSKFADITRQYLHRRLAIVLDNKIISAPYMGVIIAGGKVEITGRYTTQQATDTAILMRAGALPAPLVVIEERTVGPDLGADSISAGKFATVLAVIIVGVFMILAYSMFGIVANIAVIFNIILLIAFISVTQSTLTLPGIAGIALTIGMAVDANVLIYERIKEEIRNGANNLAAINSGYTMAMATIIDSNLTTLIGGALLFMFGSGPVKGFAVTLSMGILISMFTAITLTRLIVVYWFKWKKPKTLPI